MRKQIYIAGPMTGIDKHNFPAFFKAYSDLIHMGWNVVSPHFISIASGFNPLEEGGGETPETNPTWLAEILSADLMALARCSDIYMLEGWEDSKGANMELLFAQSCSKNIHYYNEGYPHHEK